VILNDTVFEGGGMTISLVVKEIKNWILDELGHVQLAEYLGLLNCR
jgi:hypothetical protein